MTKQGTKDAAEAVLRELPSVIGACVREDVHGRPREVHLLVRAGPNPRNLAYDVRDLLEERLGVPVDQRVISIAQLAPGRTAGPLFDPDTPAASPTAAAAPAAAAAVAATAQPAAPVPSAQEPRVRFTGISTDVMDNRVTVRVSLEHEGVERNGMAHGVDSRPARLRAGAAAALLAVDAACVGRARFEVEHVSVVHAFEREYALVSVLASSPYLGRKPIALAGAQPLEMDVESAAALAALKAVNRTVSLMLRLPDSSASARPRRR